MIKSKIKELIEERKKLKSFKECAISSNVIVIIYYNCFVILNAFEINGFNGFSSNDKCAV